AYQPGLSMFSIAGRNIPKNSEFLKMFGNGATNKAAGVETPQVTRVSPPGLGLTINTEDNVFFDFEPQTSSFASVPNPFPTPGATCMPGWGTDINFRPISPPHSAPFSPKEWSFDFSSTTPPANLVTDINPNSFRAHYGQVTPPDDDNGSLFDDELGERQDPASPAPVEERSTPPAPKRRKRNDLSSLEGGGASASASATATQATPGKRTRKHGSRASKGSPADPNNPADVRRSKFLERNRVAASKCRQKKKEWTQNLESRARDLQKNNASLRVMAESLREEVLFLKGECKKHIACECRDIQHVMKTAAQQSHGSHALSKTEPVSPVDSAPSSHVGSIDYPSRYGSEGASAKEMAEDEDALEALLTSSIEQDTSDEGIRSKVGG
ncbi:MAG: hypothetical protein Q9163_006495, partial [Psora crenata]